MIFLRALIGSHLPNINLTSPLFKKLLVKNSTAIFELNVDIGCTVSCESARWVGSPIATSAVESESNYINPPERPSLWDKCI